MTTVSKTHVVYLLSVILLISKNLDDNVKFSQGMTEKERKDSLREHRNSDINNLKSVVGNFNKKNSTLIGAEDHKKLAKELALENSEGTI